MLTGDDIKRARQMAGLSQGELAKLVGVSMRSIGNYERGETVPRGALPKLQEVLGPHLGGHGPTLETASDAELLGEIAKRFARTRTSHGAATKQAGGSPADDLENRRQRRVSDPGNTVPEDKVAMDDPDLLRESEAQEEGP